MYDMRTNLSNQVVREVKRYFDDKVYKTVIPRNIKLSEAPSYGMPITLYDANSKGARCYEKLAREIIKANETDFKDNGGEIEVDLNTLRSSTLRIIREQVDSFIESNYV